jgi:hypothetical protein
MHDRRTNASPYSVPRRPFYDYADHEAFVAIAYRSEQPSSLVGTSTGNLRQPAQDRAYSSGSM